MYYSKQKDKNSFPSLSRGFWLTGWAFSFYFCCCVETALMCSQGLPLIDLKVIGITGLLDEKNTLTHQRQVGIVDEKQRS